jgi:hypothetical protein
MKEFINRDIRYDKNKISSVQKQKSPSPKLKNYVKKARTESDKYSRCSYRYGETKKRCKNYLGLYPQFCYVHTMLIHNLQIRKSNIPNAKMGLFVGPYPFQKGTIIGKYNTKNNSLKLSTFRSRCSEDSNCHEYVFCDTQSQTCWDTKDIRSSIMRFINDSYGSNFKNNCHFKKRGDDILVIASENINPFQELFINYGKNYW